MFLGSSVACIRLTGMCISFLIILSTVLNVPKGVESWLFLNLLLLGMGQDSLKLWAKGCRKTKQP